MTAYHGFLHLNRSSVEQPHVQSLIEPDPPKSEAPELDGSIFQRCRDFLLLRLLNFLRDSRLIIVGSESFLVQELFDLVVTVSSERSS